MSTAHAIAVKRSHSVVVLGRTAIGFLDSCSASLEILHSVGLLAMKEWWTPSPRMKMTNSNVGCRGTCTAKSGLRSQLSLTLAGQNLAEASATD
jgi:hypothetical protein